MNVSFNHGSFRRRVHPEQAETKRRRTVVHRAVFRHAGIFGVLDDEKIDLARKPQRFAHYRIIKDRLAVIAYANGTGALQSAKIREDRAFASMRRRGDREDIYYRAPLRALNPRDQL